MIRQHARIGVILYPYYYAEVERESGGVVLQGTTTGIVRISVR